MKPCTAVLDISDNGQEFQNWLQDHGITYTIRGEVWNGWSAEFHGTREALEAMLLEWWSDEEGMYKSEIKEDAAQ